MMAECEPEFDDDDDDIETYFDEEMAKLIRLDDDEALPGLIAALRSPDPDIRFQAAEIFMLEALCKIDPENPKLDLPFASLSWNKDEFFRMRVAQLLGDTGRRNRRRRNILV